MSGLVAAALHGVDERRVAGRMPHAACRRRRTHRITRNAEIRAGFTEKRVSIHDRGRKVLERWRTTMRYPPCIQAILVLDTESYGSVF